MVSRNLVSASPALLRQPQVSLTIQRAFQTRGELGNRHKSNDSIREGETDEGSRGRAVAPASRDSVSIPMVPLLCG